MQDTQAKNTSISGEAPTRSFALFEAYILFAEDEAFARFEPRSRLCRTDFRPKIMRAEVGVKLAELDPDAVRFKVFFYPTEENFPAHAEVWIAREWEMSNTKLFIRRAQSEQSRQVHNKVSDKSDLIYAHLTKVMLFPANGRTRELSNALGTCPDAELYKQFQFPAELIERLTELQKG